MVHRGRNTSWGYKAGRRPPLLSVCICFSPSPTHSVLTPLMSFRERTSIESCAKYFTSTFSMNSTNNGMR